MQTTCSTITTTIHTLEPNEVKGVLEAYARQGGFGPLTDPDNDSVSVILLPDGGAGITIVNAPPATSIGI